MQKRKFVGILVIVALVLFVQPFVQPALASINGSTGLINIPTAGTLAESNLIVSYHHFKGSGTIALTMGVFNGVEVGVSSRLRTGEPLNGNLKVKLLQETSTVPAFAVGLETYMGTPMYYGVLSKQIGAAGVRGHIGIGTGKYRHGVLGISAVLNPVTISSVNKSLKVPVTTLIAEYDGSGLNTGLSFRFNSDFSGKVFVSKMKDFGFGLSYTARF